MFENLPTTFKSFYESILQHSLIALKLNRHLDNFDAIRFNYDGKDHSKEFNATMHAFYFDWFFKEAVNLFRAYSLLDAEASKKLYLHLISYRLAGHLSIKLPVDFVEKEKTQAFAAYQELESHHMTESHLSTLGMFGKLKHYDFEYNNQRYLADCLGFESYLFRKQYFYAKDTICIQPDSGDFVIDGGACTGDSTIAFSNAVGTSGKVYAFDLVKEHIQVLNHNIEQFPNKNIQIIPFGLSNKNVNGQPISLGGYAPGFSVANQPVPLRSIDYLVETKLVEKIDFIKLDVEGSELDALKGAEQSIEKFKPKLAISLYHKPQDLFEIILYIKNRFPFYLCYLDHYTIHAEETVLYCIKNHNR